MLVSVSPNTRHNCAARYDCHCATRSAKGFSQPTITKRNDCGGVSPVSDSSLVHSCQKAAGNSHPVTARRSSSRVNSAPAASHCDPVNTTAPPRLHTGNTSSANTSKLNDANCSMRSLPCNSSCRAIPSVKFTSDWCVTITPLGRPVEPDV